MKNKLQMIKMNYKNFSFDVNPSAVKIEFSKNISCENIIFSNSKTDEISFNPVIISGEGCFCGENAKDYAHELMRIFKSNGSDYLFVPDIDPIKAFFDKLCISYNADKNSVGYTFSFIEDCSDKKSNYDFGFTYALKGENLYDIANRTGVSIETIVENNDFEDLFSVGEGDKVCLN